MIQRLQHEIYQRLAAYAAEHQQTPEEVLASLVQDCRQETDHHFTQAGFIQVP